MTRATKLLLAVLAPLLVAAGLAATTSSASAVAYGGYTDWKTISAGGSHTCGIRATGQLYCWGTDGTGSALYPLSGYRDWKSVSVGTSHRCAIRGTGSLYCWGSDASGQLGNGAAGTATTPVPIQSSFTDWKSVSAGGVHTCGIRGTGLLYCWGSDANGQLGNGGGDSQSPDQIGSQTNWRLVSAGDKHTCAIRGAGTLYCWGDDTSGQLGNGGGGSEPVPKSITSVFDWKSVSAGGSHTCGIRGTGTLYCWGGDASGQVGNGTGTTADQQSPLKLTSVYDWKSVSAGGDHTCAFRGSGTLYCWGSNTYRQAAESGTASSYASPTRISSINWRVISAGLRHTCAIPSSSSRIYCWGQQKAPSNGTPAGSEYPAQLSSLGYLKAWKVTLPYDGSDADTYADEIKQPALATYRSLSYFHTNSNNTALVLRAPVGGAKTPGSVFARTELRNMAPYDGNKAVSYNWTSGTHVLEINEAYTHLPKLIPNVVGVQIHDPDHEVLMIRLDGTRLYAQVRQLNGTYTEVTFTNSYKLGTRFNAKVTANSSGIFIDYNGVRKASFVGRRPSSTVYWYFKAGCYLHSKTSAGEAPNEYGEVLIYSLKTTHS